MVNALAVLILVANSFGHSTVMFAWTVGRNTGRGLHHSVIFPDPNTPQGELATPLFTAHFRHHASNGTYLFTCLTFSEVSILAVFSTAKGAHCPFPCPAHGRRISKSTVTRVSFLCPIFEPREPSHQQTIKEWRRGV